MVWYQTHNQIKFLSIIQCSMSLFSGLNTKLHIKLIAKFLIQIPSRLKENMKKIYILKLLNLPLDYSSLPLLCFLYFCIYFSLNSYFLISSQFGSYQNPSIVTTHQIKKTLNSQFMSSHSLSTKRKPNPPFN